jgi:hypothetical protein
MKKSDITLRSRSRVGWSGPGLPALNVKWHLWVPDVIAKYRYDDHEFSGDDGFWAWMISMWDIDTTGVLDQAWQFAAEFGWDEAREAARDVWGEGAEVYSDGRSGGWLVVHGLRDVETWDAIDLGLWRMFAGRIDEIMSGLDYDFVWHAHVNIYQRWIAALV